MLFFQKLCKESIVRGLCVHGIAFHMTRASQPVINTAHYQPFKHPHVARPPPIGVEQLSGGIYEC